MCCTCGTCLVPNRIHTEFKRKLKRKRFDALTICLFVIEGGSHGARHGKSEMAKKKHFDSIRQRVQQCETCRNSQMNVGRIRNFTTVLIALHAEDHLHIAAWAERRRHGKVLLRNHLLRQPGGEHPIQMPFGPHQTGKSTERICE